MARAKDCSCSWPQRVSSGALLQLPRATHLLWGSEGDVRLVSRSSPGVCFAVATSGAPLQLPMGVPKAMLGLLAVLHPANLLVIFGVKLDWVKPWRRRLPGAWGLSLWAAAAPLFLQGSNSDVDSCGLAASPPAFARRNRCVATPSLGLPYRAAQGLTLQHLVLWASKACRCPSTSSYGLPKATCQVPFKGLFSAGSATAAPLLLGFRRQRARRPSYAAAPLLVGFRRQHARRLSNAPWQSLLMGFRRHRARCP